MARRVDVLYMYRAAATGGGAMGGWLTKGFAWAALVALVTVAAFAGAVA